MASWHPFGYEGKPDTCLWCGRKLRRRTWQIDEHEAVPHGYHLTGKMVTHKIWGKVRRTVAADKPGDYGDGHFCGLRCAYEFAVRLADLGRRLQADRDPKPNA